MYLCSMLLFNVTVIIEEASAPEWLQWMNESHIPELMATDCFVSHRVLRIVDSPNEGLSYCIQFIAETDAKYHAFKNLHEENFTGKLYEKYPNKLVVFSTLMEFIG